MEALIEISAYHTSQQRGETLMLGVEGNSLKTEEKTRSVGRYMSKR